MRADEKIHHEVVRGLAARGRRRLSGTFRAAVFGANDGLVSNLALVLGIGATGVAPQFVLFSGIAGLLAGALSMGAGEFVSVRSQRELLAATEPNGYADHVRRTSTSTRTNSRSSIGPAACRARRLWPVRAWRSKPPTPARPRRRRTTAPTRTTSSGERGERRSRASCSSPRARSSRCCRGSSDSPGPRRSIVALVLVGIALLATGAMVGLLAGGPPLRRALRQLLIGYGAAAITYCLGLLFGVSMG